MTPHPIPPEVCKTPNIPILQKCVKLFMFVGFCQMLRVVHGVDPAHITIENNHMLHNVSVWGGSHKQSPLPRVHRVDHTGGGDPIPQRLAELGASQSYTLNSSMYIRMICPKVYFINSSAARGVLSLWKSPILLEGLLVHSWKPLPAFNLGVLCIFSFFRCLMLTYFNNYAETFF